MSYAKKQLYSKYREQVWYLIFGILTTIINYFSFWLFITLLGCRFAPWANAAAFVLATAFAFVTNKRWVFRSPCWSRETVAHEAAAFTGSRLFSFGVEEAGLVFCMAALPLDQWLFWGLSGTMMVKIMLSFVAVLLNYIFSKWLVFRKGSDFHEQDT